MSKRRLTPAGGFDRPALPVAYRPNPGRLTRLARGSAARHPRLRPAGPKATDLVPAVDGWNRIADVPAVRQTERRDCGAAALEMVLGYWGKPVTIARVATVDPAAPDRGISAAAALSVSGRTGPTSHLRLPQRMQGLRRDAPADQAPHPAVRSRSAWHPMLSNGFAAWRPRSRSISIAKPTSSYASGSTTWTANCSLDDPCLPTAGVIRAALTGALRGLPLPAPG